MSNYSLALEQAEKLAEALRIIQDYNFRSYGPSGCDNHCIDHPCGPCRDYQSEKSVAKKALEDFKRWKKFVELGR